jgi:hypothetical protein
LALVLVGCLLGGYERLGRVAYAHARLYWPDPSSKIFAWLVGLIGLAAGYLALTFSIGIALRRRFNLVAWIYDSLQGLEHVLKKMRTP